DERGVRQRSPHRARARSRRRAVSRAAGRGGDRCDRRHARGLLRGGGRLGRGHDLRAGAPAARGDLRRSGDRSGSRLDHGRPAGRACARGRLSQPRHRCPGDRPDMSSGANVKSALDAIDPITFTVLRNGFRGMCSQGSALVERVAWGPVITQGRDYSVGILTGDGRLVGHGTVDITPHMGTYEFSVRAVLEDFEDTLEPGDVVIVNDPSRAGTHPQDVRLVRPVFHEGGIFAFAVACAHWSDMGGPIPGTFNPSATESWAEGVIIPPTLLYKGDKPVKSTFE